MKSAGSLATRGAWAFTSCLFVDEDLRSLILTRAPASNIAQKAMEHGMRTLRNDGWKKVKLGQDHHRGSPARHPNRRTLDIACWKTQKTRPPERFLMARLSSVNLLQTAAGGRRLWQLSAGGDRFTVQSEKALLLNERVPAGIAGKDWQTLFRGKLNLAWLPANKVFLRAVQLPASEPAEMLQMIELQLEKLSPLPVTQIVWSAYLLPRPPENQEALQTLAFCETLEPLPPPTDKPKEALQTAIVMLASRSAVEEFLGQLEADGYLADRLEAPGLDQLLAADIRQEGVWVFPGGEGDPVLVAWRYGGTVQNLTIVFLPAGPERGPHLKTQIEQMAWAGELEGWLSSPPKIHLVGGPAEANFWEPVFKEAGEQIEVVAPTPARNWWR